MIHCLLSPHGSPHKSSDRYFVLQFTSLQVLVLSFNDALHYQIFVLLIGTSHVSDIIFKKYVHVIIETYRNRLIVLDLNEILFPITDQSHQGIK